MGAEVHYLRSAKHLGIDTAESQARSILEALVESDDGCLTVCCDDDLSTWKSLFKAQARKMASRQSVPDNEIEYFEGALSTPWGEIDLWDTKEFEDYRSRKSGIRRYLVSVVFRSNDNMAAVKLKDALQEVSKGKLELAFAASDGKSLIVFLSTTRSASALLRHLQHAEPGETPAIARNDEVIIAELGNDFDTKGSASVRQWLQRTP